MEKKRILFEEKRLLENEVQIITRKEHEDLRKLLSSKPKPTPKFKKSPGSKNGTARPPQKKKKKGTTGPSKNLAPQSVKKGKKRS